jgi:hypothetical protein
VHSLVCDVASEVRMQFIRFRTVKSSAELISGIVNCVCPECGGRMGERGREFECQGECMTDWRQAWEQASAELRLRSRIRVGRHTVAQIFHTPNTDPAGAVDASPGMMPATPNGILAGQGLAGND